MQPVLSLSLQKGSSWQNPQKKIMQRLALFDIDGTLMASSGVPKEALGRSMENVFGSRGALETYELAGKTDKQIVCDVLTEAGMDLQSVLPRIEEIMREYIRILRATLRPEHCRLLPGVQTLFEELKTEPRIHLALITGNLMESAAIKLENVNLYLPFASDGQLLGGFGSDAVNRNRIAEVALERARNIMRINFIGKDITLLGDSIYDVLCAKFLGVKSIGVATGGTSVEELVRCGGECVFRDFRDTARVLEAILD
jgi:phosphoglycolate phosphatase-like HAD superfamily hydrolase